MIKQTIVVAASVLSVGCMTVKTPDSAYIMVGNASVEECKQIIHVDEKEEIKFDCKIYESHGISTIGGQAIAAFFTWAVWPW